MKPFAAVKPESAHDILKQTSNPLDPFFTPRNVAIIGATENPGSVGRTTLWNLISSPFGGAVFPVNPKRPSVLGIKAYPTVKDIPAEVDLVVIVHAAEVDTRHYSRLRRDWGEGGRGDLRRVQGSRRGRQAA